jgi:MFS transporter, ACS family, D-galactonate transporter
MTRIPSQSTTATKPTTAVRWNVVLLLMAMAFMCHFNRISMPVAGTAKIMEEYEIDKVSMGMVYSCYLLIYTICMIPGGWLIDRYGAKFALAAMGLGSAVFVFLTGSIGFLVAPALVLAALLVVRSMTGLVSVPMHPGAAHVVASWMPQQDLARANGLVTAAALCGIASTYYLFGMLIDRFGWPTAFMISGGVTLAIALAWTFYATSSPADHPHVSDAELRLIIGHSTDAPRSENAATWYSLLGNRSLMLLTLSYSAVGYFQYLFFYWLEFYFKDVLKLDTDTGRLYATIPTLSMAAGMFLGGWVADALSRRAGARRGRAQVAAGGLLAGTLFLGLGVFAHDPRWIVVWFSLAMAAVGMSEGPFWVTAIELGGSQGGASAAIFNTGGNFGGILAPVATPLLSNYLGWQGALPVAGFFCLVGAALWFWIHPDERLRLQTSPTVIG